MSEYVTRAGLRNAGLSKWAINFQPALTIYSVPSLLRSRALSATREISSYRAATRRQHNARRMLVLYGNRQEGRIRPMMAAPRNDEHQI